MSTPHPDTQIRIYDEMLKRKYKFHSGDIVKIIDEISDIKGTITAIRYPYYYPIDGDQAYITDNNPIPYKDKELELIGKNPNGEKQTYEYLENCKRKSDSKEYRDSYVFP